MSDSPLLTARNLTAGYRTDRAEKRVISGADLEIRAGEVTCLLGANGAGKSTLLRTLCGEQPPLEGEVMLSGIPVNSLGFDRRARMISMVYTGRHNGAGALTVTETVGLGRQPYTGFFGRLDSDDHRIVAESLEAVGMSAFASRYLATLSDGERQKVMIARALAQQTPLMLMDEPTSFLDVASRLEVMALMERLAGVHGKAVLLSTHDVAEALTVASRLWLVMPGGKIVSGTPDHLIDSGHMDRLFPGRNIFFDRSARDYRLKTIHKT